MYRFLDVLRGFAIVPLVNTPDGADSRHGWSRQLVVTVLLSAGVAVVAADQQGVIARQFLVDRLTDPLGGADDECDRSVGLGHRDY